MARAADIERIFAHIGSADMKYQEFEPPPDTDQARANWSLLHSATESGDADEAARPIRPPAPEQRPSAFRERIAERPVERAPEAPRVEPPVSEAGPAAADEHGRGSLRQVFARLGGSPASEAPADRPEQRAETPLSRVFKRLS